MGLLKAFTRKRNVAGTLGPVQRSIGYLQGGYKDTTVHSRVQLFNTLTQVGQLVYDTGYQRYYRPGLSGGHSGFFSISDTVAFNKFNYITASASGSFSIGRHPGMTASDLNVYSQGWILATNAPSMQNAIDEYFRVDMATDTPVSKGNLQADGYSSTRQGMSTGAAGFFCNVNSTNTNVLSFVTETANIQIGNALFAAAGMQIPCGMSVNNTKGYMVGMGGRNVRMTVNGSTVVSTAQATTYSYNFGESHAIASATKGYMMAGYSDTTGRYGNTQHGLCQSINFANEAIATLPDLVLPQSSGQMMQGF